MNLGRRVREDRRRTARRSRSFQTSSNVVVLRNHIECDGRMPEP